MVERKGAGIAAVNSIALCCLLFSCSEPSVQDFFISSAQAPYEFRMDMSDTLAVYDLVFFTKCRADVADMRLDVTWISPSGDSVCETVYLPAFGVKGIAAPYRSGVAPPSAGEWVLRVDVPDEPEGLCGLGLTVTKKRKWDTGN